MGATSVIAIMAGINDGLESLKNAREFVGKLGKSQSAGDLTARNLELAEVSSGLLNVTQALASSGATIIELQMENSTLKESLKRRGTERWEAPFYYLIQEDGKKDGPYCQRCRDKDGIYMRLQHYSEKVWNCLDCKSSHRTEIVRSNQQISISL